MLIGGVLQHQCIMFNFKNEKHMSKENYDALEAVLTALPVDQVKIPRIPVDVTVQEAEDLFVWATEDREALESKGMNWTATVEEIPARSGALRHAQALWMKERYTQEEALKQWSNQSPEAYTLRDDLLADLRFAYRKREDLLGRVSAIAEGSGNADMIQDLSDISVLGKANLEELSAINFDLTLLDTAATRSGELADLLAKSNGSRLDNTKAKEMRDKAHTYLKEVVDEVRDFGKYVFRKDPQRFKGYISRYRK